MLPIGSIFFPLIVVPIKRGFLIVETNDIFQKLVYLYKYASNICTRDMCLSVAYCVNEFETTCIFRGLIFGDIVHTTNGLK